MTEKKKYKSSRLEGMQGKWSDHDFLTYVMYKVDYRTNNKEIYMASGDRFLDIMTKLEKMTVEDLIDYKTRKSEAIKEFNKFMISGATDQEKFRAMGLIHTGYDIHGNPINIVLTGKPPLDSLNKILDAIDEEE